MNPGRAKVEEEGVCRVCGVGPSWKVEAAHLWPRSLGAKGFSDPHLILPLDHPCHAAFDAGELDVLPYLTLDEQLATVRAAGGIERARRRLVGGREREDHV